MSDASQSQLILYQTADGQTRIQCRFENQNVWLTQALMAELFQTTVPNINLHIKNILDEGELTEGATIKDYLIVRLKGGRQVRRPRPSGHHESARSRSEETPEAEKGREEMKLETLNAQARDLEQTIARNVAEILEG
ncbi:MAG TPA: hypothetical protein VEH04_07100 [Verrucomicrobiae bacterium]|nr:hypothetical protein [Verrucomicrobiae bacterium]